MDTEGRIFGRGNAPGRTYVDAVIETSADGLVTPLSIESFDGTRHRIDRVLDRRPAQTLKHARDQGISGMRFTVLVGANKTHLWYDDMRGAFWVEAL